MCFIHIINKEMMTVEHIQLSNVDRFHIVAMSRSCETKKTLEGFVSIGLLVKSYDHLTEIFTESKIFSEKSK
jgi:hypothetical protein